MSIMRGQVNKGGGRELGQGFSATRNREGDYTVKFDSSFKYPPVVVATAQHTDSGGDRIVTLYKSSSSGFSVTTMKRSERRDSAFNFYASDDYNTP